MRPYPESFSSPLGATQNPRRFAREICENAGSACTLETGEGFHHHLLAIEPTALDCGYEHGVFAGHLVSKYRDAKTVLYAPDDVEIGHAGFDHHHVCAFCDIKRHLAQRFITVRGVHLICT